MIEEIILESLMNEHVFASRDCVIYLAMEDETSLCRQHDGGIGAFRIAYTSMHNASASGGVVR